MATTPQPNPTQPTRKRAKSIGTDEQPSQKRHHPWQPKPKNAPIPAPLVLRLNSVIGGNRSMGRSPKSQEDSALRSATYKVGQWKKNVPTFYIPGVKLAALDCRPKNSQHHQDEANRMIHQMQDSPADACSGIWEDEDGQRLLCVFAHRILSASPLPKEKTPVGLKKEPERIPYPGPMGRTLEKVEEVQKEGHKVVYDGIPNALLQRTHEATQLLHSRLPPVAANRDIHHPSQKVMAYRKEGNNKTFFEQAGKLHLAHAMEMQGQPAGLLIPSSDMTRTSQGALAVNHYFQSTRMLALYLAQCFKAAFPDIYLKYQKAFDAGVWNDHDPGPWIGRVTVWKLPVLTHQDGLDDGPTAAFNFGAYSGGEMYMPDIGVKIAYRPGDLLIFLSGQLFHCVGEWAPLVMKKEDKLTPGRIGNVFFFPKSSLNILKDKPPGWNKSTVTGTFPDARI